ncbi:MAG: uridine kinase [Phycisphaerae bacterium]
MNRELLLAELAADIVAIERDHPVRVAIDGLSASGKTILADELAEYVRLHGRAVIRAGIDGFHRPPHERYARGKDSVEGYYHDSFNYPAVREKLLDPLGPHGDGRYLPALRDHTTEADVAHVTACAPPEAILLFEGVMILRDELNDCWDYRIYVHADTDVILQRAMGRDARRLGGTSAVRSKYLSRYLPGQQMYLELVSPQDLADVVIDNSDPADPRVHTPDRNRTA